MFKLCTKVGAMALLALTAFSAPALAVEFSGSVSTEVSNMDLWRGQDAAPDSDFVVLPAVELDMTGVGAGTFGLEVTSTADENGGIGGAEVSLGYTMPVALGGINSNITVGNLTQLINDFENTNEAFVSIELDTMLAPTFTALYDYDQAEGDGMFFTLGVSDSIQACDGVTVTADALVSYNQESDYLVGNYSDLHNAELTLTADWAVTEQLTISPNATFSTPLSDDAEDIGGLDDEAKFGVNLAINF